LSNEPDNLLLQADGLFDCRRLDDAQARYEEYLEKQPDSWHALNRLARIQALRGRIRAMVRTCFRWQDVLQRQGLLDLAGAVAEAIVRFDPHSLEGRVGILRHLERTADETTFVTTARRDARFFVEVGNGELAIQVLCRALETCPDNIELSMDLADVHMAQGHLQEAVAQFRHLAATFRKSGNLARATDSYRRLKVLTPDSPEVAMDLGQIYMEQERYADAMIEFRTALRLNLNHRDALMGLGEAASRKGSLRDAVLAFKKLLALDPRDTQAHVRLGEAFLGNGLVAEAVKEFLTAGSILVESGEFAEARSVYGRILELEPDHPTATREISNANAALAERQVHGAPGGAATPAAVDPVPSEEDLYAYAPPSEEDLYAAPVDAKVQSILGAPDGESASLGAPTQAQEAAGTVRSPGARVCPPLEPTPGQLHRPVPFVLLGLPGLIGRIREQVDKAPDPEQIPWTPLPDMEQVRVGAAASTAVVAATPSQVFTSALTAGPVQSAFGLTGDFSQAFSSGTSGGRRRRRERWDDMYPPRDYRSGPSSGPDPAAALADRIARRRRGEQDGEEKG
jgi:tetratricopeptide (TPR) repeat protein